MCERNEVCIGPLGCYLREFVCPRLSSQLLICYTFVSLRDVGLIPTKSPRS